ncbi:ephrin type-B receptor 5-like isoform X2 [Oculina patagonica]
MILPGFLLSWLIVFVSGETEILVNEPPDVGLWYWNIKTDSQGAGWIHPSNLNKRYTVCDISDGITREPNNWLRTDFVDVRNATQLDIEVHYSLRNCPLTSISRYCKTYFTLYSYHADSRDPIPDPTKGVFQNETVITPTTLPKPGELVKDIFRGLVVPKAKGIYLAFLDQGACIAMTKVIISYRYCPKNYSTFVIFPRTAAPANNSDLIEQEGKCADVNSINKVKLSGVCLSSGQWNTTDDLACLCKAGYQLVNGTIAPLECKECSNDSYKSTIGNAKCLPCPANSASNAQRTACTCDGGFYNSSDLRRCKALPQAPLEAKTTLVEATYVVISWHRSPDDNGTLTYAVDCFTCKSRESKNCTEACDRQVTYLPGKDNLTGVNVTVRGLSSSSFYLFRVYSVSELNQQEKDRGKWQFATVFVETKALPQAPLEANTTVVEATYVVISWHRSPDDNGTLTYAVDCFTCKSRESKNCTEVCDRQVRYLPGKDNLTGVNVTVRGLSSSSFYLFRVYSVSELNQQEKDRGKWQFATVFVETKASTTSVRFPTTKALTTIVVPTTKASTTSVATNNAVLKEKLQNCKNENSMYLKIIYGLVGLLTALVTSVVSYIFFKRWRHRNKARGNEVPTTKKPEIRVYGDICELGRV